MFTRNTTNTTNNKNTTNNTNTRNNTNIGNSNTWNTTNTTNTTITTTTTTTTNTTITTNTTNTTMTANTMCKIINIKKTELVKNGYTDFSQWNLDINHIYIGRNMSHYVPGTNASIWGNPYHVVKTGKKYNGVLKLYTIDESLEKYRQYVENNPNLLNRLSDLKGKVLGCWCKPNKCHGDILVELVNKYCKN